MHDQLFELLAIDGGFHVKNLENGMCVDVLRMMINWRLVRSDLAHTTYDRGWCYAGTDRASLLLAIGEALIWDGADGTEPANWNKRAIPFAEHAVELRPTPRDVLRSRDALLRVDW